ncbi:RHS repeat-associated core domain-containing protein [Pseudomonas sp. 5P_5.1_Bac1]|uniref:RHS repeat-associated core domain-containing protein n=1 Tax=Pseudomonas sp. 5P_5.1_Bac1 TaxID=2971616 RepID=UPI0021CA2293|nr:RHS repeat-associated core domain-containing protein [Pseudomonas sp. 5P_5.1_Bac1]MCU1724401.1 RHS repeat-associated core domain-containing protein [Pseudomonas sp. 5P_5.1_Bac1]
MRSATHLHTPDLNVGDSLGRPLRQVAYCRDTPEQTAERRVTLSRYDAAGQWSRQWDPRLFERLDQGDSVAPGQALLSSLSGNPLWLESADAGWRLTLFGDAGQSLENWDSRDSHWQTDYDERLRPVLIRETTAEQPARAAERFSYGGAEASADNRCGRLLRHDDEAGSRLIPGYSLGGAEQGEIRLFLADLDLPDWPAATGERDALLEPGDGAHTTFLHGPLGEVLEQTDALGNRHSSRFNLAGELASITLRLEDGSEHELLGDVRYNAFGQIESQTAGNGVISLAHYDPADGRLQRLSASRPERGALQDLIYAYDRVGNVLRIEDLSQPVSHFSNQKVDPVSTFHYDSLYHLIEATGREATGAAISPGLPPMTPAPGDTSRLLNYRQHYEYDASGNLLSLQHIGWQAYNRHMAVADDSNHALPWVDGVAPENPRAGFDRNGNLLHLQPGQPLQWNASNQLHSTRQVAREDGENDEEHYRYGGDGLRVRKVTTRLVGGRLQRSEVRYLPGLELRNRDGERLSVINLQAGRCAVRCLHWLEGKPDGIDTPQLRYSLGDHLDSGNLELDGEARIISHEGYYPFGGTAWWAAHSAVEAGYKVRRYAGKERDASGLYDYGLRYYAPWLARWINPDPAGDVDGLNRFAFVRNNPLTWRDLHGLNANYAVQPFSKEAKRSLPAGLINSGSSQGVSLRASEGPAVDFAYNVIWSTKRYLSRGAGNQLGDVLRSAYTSAIYSSMLRQTIDPAGGPTDWRAHAEHGLATATGLCDEHAAVFVHLAASSAQWPGTPVSIAQTQDHSFGMLGDPRLTDPIVVDPWVTAPVPHPLSWGQNSIDQPTLDFTPRMPGDPGFAISTERVAELRAQHYSTMPALSQNWLANNLMEGVNSRSVWSQTASLSEAQSIYYRLDGQQFDAALVPASQFEAVVQSLQLAGKHSANPRIGPLLRRF